MPRDPSQTTVYSSNARRGDAFRCSAGAWDPRIARLVARDFAFLPLCYGGDGYLFRGLDRGLATALAQGRFEANAGAHSLACLERDLDVLLVSQDFSDALAVSRLWAGDEDAAVLVIPAALFAAEHARGRAAVLGFADPGVVFRYPFLLAPLALASVAAIIVHSATRACAQAAATAGIPLLVPETPAAASRTDFEQACTALLAATGYTSAEAQPASVMPRISRGRSLRNPQNKLIKNN